MDNFTAKPDELRVYAEDGSGGPPNTRYDEWAKNRYKDVAKRAWVEGYELGYGVEELQEIDIRTAEERFERWWKINED